MSFINDWLTARSAIVANFFSFAALVIAILALLLNRRAVKESRRNANAAETQVRNARPRPIATAEFIDALNSSPSFTITNIGTATAFDVEISDLILDDGLAITTTSLPYLEAGKSEFGVHQSKEKGMWSQFTGPDEFRMLLTYFTHKAYNPNGDLVLPVEIRYRSVTGERFQTDLELRLDKNMKVSRLFPRGSLIGGAESKGKALNLGSRPLVSHALQESPSPSDGI